MRVLLIDVNCKSSSTGQIVYNLYSSLNDMGNEVAICYGRGPAIYENNIFKFGLDWETYLHALLTRITGFTGCFSFFSTRRLLKYIEKFKPDIVHIHELHAYFVNIKPLLYYLAKKNIKVVHTLHCEFSYTGKCGHSVECEKWMSECGPCPNLKKYPSSYIFDHTRYMQKKKREAFSRIKDLTLITPSRWLADRAKLSFFKDRKIVVVNNGIDTNIFKPRNSSLLRKELGIAIDTKVILSVAPNLMSKEKGGETILNIARRLEDKNIVFILVGVDEPESIICKNAIVKGRINDKELLAQYYSLADLFLICSERENFPTTCLEAQSCGTLIVGFDTGGVRETCINDDLLSVNQSIDEIVRFIEASPKKTEYNSKHISKIARDKYDMNISIKEQLKIYQYYTKLSKR